jgi:hypothetical protein
MNVTRDQLATLLRLVERTREHEIDCGEFLARLPASLDARVVDAPGGARGDVFELPDDLAHHLAQCAECCEELQALVHALRGIAPST